MSDFFNDGPGVDFADIARLQSLANQGKITAQQKQILDALVQQKKERERRASLPDCPFCGHKLPKPNVSICGQCRSTLHWNRCTPFQSQSDANAHEREKQERDRHNERIREQRRQREAAEPQHSTLINNPLVALIALAIGPGWLLYSIVGYAASAPADAATYVPGIKQSSGWTSAGITVLVGQALPPFALSVLLFAEAACAAYLALPWWMAAIAGVAGLAELVASVTHPGQ
jgi:hypothetical protein